MIHECFVVTNQLSPTQISQINFTLRNPLRADFRLLTNISNQRVVEFACDLQQQCRQVVELCGQPQTNTALPAAIEILDIRAETRAASHRHYTLDLQAVRQPMIEMIQEDLHRESCDLEKIDCKSLDLLVAFYLLTEALVLLECGVCTVSEKGHTILFQKTPAFERALHTHWFGNAMSTLSKTADIVRIQRILEEGRAHGYSALALCRKHPGILDQLTTVQIDKALSLNQRFLHKLPAPLLSSISAVWERTRIASLIQLLWAETMMEYQENAMENPPNFRLTPTTLSDLRIPAKIWRDMDAASARKPPHDKLVVKLDEDLFQIGPLSVEQIMVQYCAEDSENFRSLYGKWFEKEYLYAYIDEEVSRSRYRVYPGGKAKGRMEKKFDIDLIIEDVEADRLMFCQVKYRHNPNFPFFRSDWHEFFMGNTIPKAILQLKNFSQSFDEPAVLDLIRTRTGRKNLDAAYLAQRTSLVLIHNLNNLDFGQYDGVLLYQWNTLRNLLKRRIGQASGHPDEGFKHYGSRVPLEDIEATIAHMHEHVLNHPNAPDLGEEWDLFSKANIHIEWEIKPQKPWDRLPWRKPRQIIFPFT